MIARSLRSSEPSNIANGVYRFPSHRAVSAERDGVSPTMKTSPKHKPAKTMLDGMLDILFSEKAEHIYAKRLAEAASSGTRLQSEVEVDAHTLNSYQSQEHQANRPLLPELLG